MEVCLIHRNAKGWGLGGYLVRHENGPWQIGYRIICNASWTTREAKIFWWQDGTHGSCRLNHDGSGNWRINGENAPGLQGCMDVDLGFSPATNTLPIRRLQQAALPGGTVSAAWLRFPEMTVERLEQCYTWTRPGQWRYRCATGFEALIEVDRAG